MGLVFFFSARTADESSKQSNFIFNILVSLFGSEELTETVVRKAAHFSEFALLCFLFNFSFYFSYDKKPKRILSLVLTSAYAVTDEIHQIFVEGRSCQFFDWAIDTAGAAAGLLAFMIIIWAVNKCTVNIIKN